MKKVLKTGRILGYLGCLLFGIMCNGSMVSAAEKTTEAPMQYIEGQVIIAAYHEQQDIQFMCLDSSEQSLEQELEECGVSNIDWIGEYASENQQVGEVCVQSLENTADNTEKVDFYVGYYEENRNVWEVIEELEQIENVVKAEPNYCCYSYAEEWEYSFTEEEIQKQWHLEAIRAVDAWKTLEDNGKIPGEGVVVAVVDTGVSMAHTGLCNNIWKNMTEANGVEGIDDDGNGYVDDIDGVNMANTFPEMTDSCGHGTLMSGIIGLEAGNGEGTGVAYGAKVMPVKVSRDGNFGTDMAVKGIAYAVANGADVISMSFGTYYDSYLLQTAIRSASEKCMLVAAAGNESLPTEDDSDTYTDAKNVYPASYTNVIGVMATDPQGTLGEYSNWDAHPGEGAEYELAAPGTMIYSSYLRGGYDTTTGTSAATAVTAGALAVWRSLYPDKEEYPPAALQQMFLQAQKHTVNYMADAGTVYTYPFLDMMDLVEYAITQDIVCDKQSPQMKNRTGNQFQAGSCVKFQVEATDNVGIDSVKVYYRSSGENMWHSASMDASTQADEKNLYEVEVKTTQFAPGNLEYYFEAYDGTFYTLLGNEQQTLSLLLYKNKITCLTVKPLAEMTFTGEALTPDVEIRDGEYRLVQGKDYLLSYENNVQVGTALVYITGTGIYTEQMTTYFFIIKSGQETPDSEQTKTADAEQTEASANGQEVAETAKQQADKFKKSKVILKRTYGKKRKKAKLSWKLPGQNAEKWYIYRSSQKNKGYKLWKITKKRQITVTCKKKKMYYKIVAVKKIQGKLYKSRKSEAKVCTRT